MNSMTPTSLRPASADEAQDAHELIECLRSRALELDSDAANAHLILTSALREFLADDRGQEFAEALREATHRNYRDIREQARTARLHLEQLEAELRVESAVFAFVEALVYRLRRRVAPID